MVLGGHSHYHSTTKLILGGKRTIGLVNLNEPKVLQCKASRQTSKWDVTSLNWAPLLEDRVALAANDRIEIVNPAKNLTYEEILHSHTRHISDIDWNPSEANLLASTSHDGHLHVWDIKEAARRQRPALTFNTMASASQVRLVDIVMLFQFHKFFQRWNKQSGNIIATAHDGDVKIWDTRKASMPILYITAHISRIYSLDWSPLNKDLVVTSAQDCFVRFHTIGQSQAKVIIIVIDPI